MAENLGESNNREVRWMYIILNLHFLFSSIFALILIFKSAFLTTTLFCGFLILLGYLGVTAGSHRLWAHGCYEATPFLRVVLMVFQTLAGQNSIYNWVRFHRLHHKYRGTDIDPVQADKGFVFSHIVASNLNLSPKQEKLLAEIDMSDLEKDKIVMFQHRFYWILYVVVALLLPINAPFEYWGEDLINSVFIMGWFRMGVVYHLALLITSGASIFDLNSGQEKQVADSNMVFFVNKTYWLSYHYLAPWDYQTSEFGKFGTDCTSKFIRVCAALEMATNLRTVETAVAQEALVMSVNEDKPVEDCLKMLCEQSETLPKEHYLLPSKFYH